MLMFWFSARFHSNLKGVIGVHSYNITRNLIFIMVDLSSTSSWDIYLFIYFFVFYGFFVFHVADLPHSPWVVYYHLLLRRETRNIIM